MIIKHSLFISIILFMRLVTFHTSKLLLKFFITSTSNGIIRSSSLSFICFRFCVVYPDQTWWHSSESATVLVFACYGAATTILHQTDSGTMSKRHTIVGKSSVHVAFLYSTCISKLNTCYLRFICMKNNKVFVCTTERWTLNWRNWVSSLFSTSQRNSEIVHNSWKIHFKLTSLT